MVDIDHAAETWLLGVAAAFAALGLVANAAGLSLFSPVGYLAGGVAGARLNGR